MSSATLIGIGLFAAGIAAIRQYCKGGKCQSKERLEGKTVIITGANTGIGKETAKDLAKRGCKLILACRDMDRAKKAADEIKCSSGITDNLLSVEKLDLNSLKSVRDFADKIIKQEAKIDILINNAGIMVTPYGKTEDGFESQFGVNHLGHFLLTNLLLDKLKAAPEGRVVVVSSRAHIRGIINFDDLMSEKSYSRKRAYEQSKLANVLFARELARRLKGSTVTTYSLHPGVVRTELGRHIPLVHLPVIKQLTLILTWPILKNAEEGAQTTIYCAVEPSIANDSGKYYVDCAEANPSPAALDDTAADRLWRISEKLVGLAK